MKLIAVLLLALNLAALFSPVAATHPLWKKDLPAPALASTSDLNGDTDGQALEVKTVPEQCLALGWIDDVLVAQKIAEWLTLAGFTAQLEAVDKTTGLFDYRVLLSAMPSLQGAYRRLRELKSRGIDSYVITGGDNSPGISLGVFSSQAAAIRRQRELTHLGYDVHIKEIQRLARSYRIIVSEDADQQFSEGITLSVQAEFPSTRLVKLICPAAGLEPQ